MWVLESERNEIHPVVFCLNLSVELVAAEAATSSEQREKEEKDDDEDEDEDEAETDWNNKEHAEECENEVCECAMQWSQREVDAEEGGDGGQHKEEGNAGGVSSCEEETRCTRHEKQRITHTAVEKPT